MRVPASHYIYFWSVNTIMAVATGFVMGLMFGRAISGLLPMSTIFLWVIISAPFYFPIGFFIFFQVYAVSFFRGVRRGEFEYSYLEKSAERGKQHREIGRKLKAVKQELKMGGPTYAHQKLKSLREQFPENFVISFKYALSCERMGSSDEAIEAYEAAKQRLPASAEALRAYVRRQVERVKQKGVSKRSSNPGLQYVMY